MHDSQHTAVKLQWLTTINDNNAFETLSTVISALALQHAACMLSVCRLKPLLLLSPVSLDRYWYHH